MRKTTSKEAQIENKDSRVAIYRRIGIATYGMVPFFLTPRHSTFILGPQIGRGGNLIKVIIALVMLSSSAQALNLDWSGYYRAEAVQIDNTEQGGAASRDKGYLLHHLVLSPEVIIADGITVFGRFDIFNNSNLTNTQFGQFFGNGVGSGGGTSADDTNALSQSLASETIAVNALYLQYKFEFASLTIGRQPLHFGLGITHNAGLGEFDHYFDNRDMVAFKMDFGNLTFTPMIAKVSEGNLDQNDDVSDLMLMLDYDNVETETAFGLFMQWRRAPQNGNDFPVATGETLDKGFKGSFFNFYLKRGFGAFSIGTEGGFHSAETGVKDASNSDIDIESFGIALELDYQPEGSNWDWFVKTGLIQGDDPATTDTIEGFFFDRNYDVGFLLFNHLVGQFDVFGTSRARDVFDFGPTDGGTTATSQPDVEVMSNIVYFVPGFNYQWSKNWVLGSRVVYAILAEDNVNIGGTNTKVDGAVGFEVDFDLTYRPHERFTWKTEIGLLFPGKAFEGGSNGFETETAYGVTTKAVVTF